MASNAFDWIISNHRKWNKRRGYFGSLDEFADFLLVDRELFNRWLTRKEIPDVEDALRICKRVWDFSLLDTLGYLDDTHLINMEDKSVEYVLRLRAATFEAKRTIKIQNLDARGKDEKEEVLDQIFSSYRFYKSGGNSN